MAPRRPRSKEIARFERSGAESSGSSSRRDESVSSRHPRSRGRLGERGATPARASRPRREEAPGRTDEQPRQAQHPSRHPPSPPPPRHSRGHTPHRRRSRSRWRSRSRSSPTGDSRRSPHSLRRSPSGHSPPARSTNSVTRHSSRQLLAAGSSHTPWGTSSGSRSSPSRLRHRGVAVPDIGTGHREDSSRRPIRGRSPSPRRATSPQASSSHQPNARHFRRPRVDSPRSHHRRSSKSTTRSEPGDTWRRPDNRKRRKDSSGSRDTKRRGASRSQERRQQQAAAALLGRVGRERSLDAENSETGGAKSIRRNDRSRGRSSTRAEQSPPAFKVRNRASQLPAATPTAGKADTALVNAVEATSGAEIMYNSQWQGGRGGPGQRQASFGYQQNRGGWQGYQGYVYRHLHRRSIANAFAVRLLKATRHSNNHNFSNTLMELHKLATISNSTVARHPEIITITALVGVRRWAEASLASAGEAGFVEGTNNLHLRIEEPMAQVGHRHAEHISATCRGLHRLAVVAVMHRLTNRTAYPHLTFHRTWTNRTRQT